MNFFIGILLFLLIIYHTCILAPKKFVNLKVKEKNKIIPVLKSQTMKERFLKNKIIWVREREKLYYNIIS
jgi:hypothetical protein